MAITEFIKMHGLGNDFVIFDARRQPVVLDGDGARAIADRHRGVGCDQVIVVEPAANGAADVFMRIRNADGGEVEACGNAARCIGAMVLDETGAARARIATLAGVVEAWRAGDAAISVDMGTASDDWRKIPLAREADTLHLGIGEGVLHDPVAVNMGNPHAVFFVDDADAVPLEVVGPVIEHHEIYPERTNVEAVTVRGPDYLRVRVWERGVGITQACGTGACAALVAAVRRDLTGRIATVTLDGGDLTVEWREDGHVIMTGPVSAVYRGQVDLEAVS